MPATTHLTSTSNPRIKALVRLRKQAERRRTGVFIAEGNREVTRARDAGLELLELYHCAELTEVPSWMEDEAAAKVSTVTAGLIGKIAYRENPEGLLAVFRQPGWSLDELFDQHPAGDDELWLAAVGTQKPGNLGAMARSAQAAGCRALLVADAVVDPFNPNAIRASTGAVFTLPVVALPAGEMIERLHNRGVQICAASPAATIEYTQADLSGPVAIMVGAEDCGFDDTVLRRIVSGGPPDDTKSAEPSIQPVRIPMADSPIDSLNAATCAAVLLFEAVRQRSAAANRPESG